VKFHFQLRTIARWIALFWAGWWTFFAVASWSGEGGRVDQLLIPATAVVAFAASALIPWKWERTGGALLVLEGLVVIAGYPLMVNHQFSFATVLFVIGTLGVPTLVAGLLFLCSAYADQTRHPA
jgi:hypothetical protein